MGSHQIYKVSYARVPATMYLGRDLRSVSSKADELLSVIENQDNTKVLSFVSAYNGEGAEDIAYSAGLTLAAIGKRVLVIDASISDHGAFRELRYRLPKSLNEELAQTKTGDGSHTVLNIEGTDLYYTSFYRGAADQETVFGHEQLQDILTAFKGAFDRIFIVSEMEIGVSLPRLSPVTDAFVVVVEAERTRKPVVSQLLENIRQNSGTILGLVLNKRPLYIPPIVYRALFRN